MVQFDLFRTITAGTSFRESTITTGVPGTAQSNSFMAGKIGREYERAQAKKIFRNMLDVSANVVITDDEVIVTPDKRAHNPYLVASGLAEEPTSMPWFGGRRLVITFA